MRMIICAVLAIVLVACTGKTDNNNKATKPASEGQNIDPVGAQKNERQPDSLAMDSYSNERFRDVVVEKTGDDTFTVRGKARVFEATFGWVVEDGHYELKEGFHTAEVGAPEWGSFEFTVEVQKERPNSTLTLILFESSAKDGSRQHELPIPLE